jgi:hypothetical protein
MCLSAKGRSADVYLWQRVTGMDQDNQIWEWRADGTIVLASWPDWGLTVEEERTLWLFSMNCSTEYSTILNDQCNEHKITSSDEIFVRGRDGRQFSLQLLESGSRYLLPGPAEEDFPLQVSKANKNGSRIYLTRLAEEDTQARRHQTWQRA